MRRCSGDHHDDCSAGSLKAEMQARADADGVYRE